MLWGNERKNASPDFICKDTSFFYRFQTWFCNFFVLKRELKRMQPQIKLPKTAIWIFWIFFSAKRG
jgi:hypothetical protein